MRDKDLSSFTFSLELEGDKRISGNHLFNLLDYIRVHGSISHAASVLGVSYRYAWGLIREAEKALGLQLVVKQVGGVSGGGASLTSEGNNLLEQYRSLKTEVDSRLLSKEKTGETRDTKLAQPGKQKSDQLAKEGSTVRHILIASTMELVETGLLDVLEDVFFQSTGILVRHIALGSGRALEIAREGRVDLVITHAPELEEKFMEEGMGSWKIPLMSNHFALVGPSELIQEVKPENNSSPTGIIPIFQKIASSGLNFVSRGDQSGTHMREQKIWKTAGVNPPKEVYTVSSGVAGNLGILNLANEKRAFALVDRASYIIAQNKSHVDNLEIVYGDAGNLHDNELLCNIFVLITVNPECFSSVNYEDAISFARWLQWEGKEIVAGFGEDKFQAPLFYPV